MRLYRLFVLALALSLGGCASPPTPSRAPLYNRVDLIAGGRTVASLAVALPDRAPPCEGATRGVWALTSADTSEVADVVAVALRRGLQPSTLEVTYGRTGERSGPRLYLDTGFRWLHPESLYAEGTDRLWLVEGEYDRGAGRADKSRGEWTARRVRRADSSGTVPPQYLWRSDTLEVHGVWRSERPLDLGRLAGPPCPPW